MAMKRNCPKPNCIKTADGRYCTEHNREHDKQRGSKKQRGYGKEFQRDRKQWKPLVDAGLVDCWRCSKPLEPGAAFHLGHDDKDRTIIRGPECPPCNLSAAGKSSALYR